MKIIFLDRDGVINKDPGNRDYVKSWDEFYFLPRAIEAIKKLTDAEYNIVIISNQAGVNKGLYTEKDVATITKNMLKEIEKQGAKIKAVHYCIHRDEDECNCRKPKTGLFKKALSELGILRDEVGDPTYFIGDGLTDVEAGKKEGYKTILLLCGKSNAEDVKDWKVKPDYVVKDLWEAVNLIINKD